MAEEKTDKSLKLLDLLATVTLLFGFLFGLLFSAAEWHSPAVASWAAFFAGFLLKCYASMAIWWRHG